MGPIPKAGPPDPYATLTLLSTSQQHLTIFRSLVSRKPQTAIHGSNPSHCLSRVAAVAYALSLTHLLHSMLRHTFVDERVRCSIRKFSPGGLPVWKTHVSRIT